MLSPIYSWAKPGYRKFILPLTFWKILSSLCLWDTVFLSSHIRSPWTDLHATKNPYRNLPSHFRPLKKKALCNLIYAFLKGASVSYELGQIVTRRLLFPTPSPIECKGAYFSLTQVFFYLCAFLYRSRLQVVCLEVSCFFFRGIKSQIRSKIRWKNKWAVSLGLWLIRSRQLLFLHVSLL